MPAGHTHRAEFLLAGIRTGLIFYIWKAPGFSNLRVDRNPVPTICNQNK